ncbi:rhamnan synthesis F family protein [Roseospira visakhapatnamensis]|uniref:Glycosyltransferase involved in cell wall biosynthesis n=1 Tax=Roseospira visakhapatnamensis TaxID=390880 RepID=A0A7W6WB10_9PROT|nr:rhamnan synthesis F family protein [Roseospira visakhapatnamensis]MBB4267062.1 glycosyltransferase involved in cell wall biosynthesis [Roseospira visakhapatnamensis]
MTASSPRPTAPALATPVWRTAVMETMTPRRLVPPESWVGHIPFAFWIVGAHRPRRIVELGVHTGNSYCAFNQAVAHLGLETTCLGIDHWLGDPQAGFYGEDVLAALRAHHDPLYGGVSTLLRMSFADGRAHAADGSVDLLHIDGLHTYEAVREDFETWRDKMSDRGIVLFHDTTVRTGDFGVWKFWEEIAARYPTFAFDHSNGLGVAYVGTRPIPDPDLEALFAAGDGGDRDAIRRYFASLGDGCLTRFHLIETRRDWAEARREWAAMRDDVGAIEADRRALRQERDVLRARASLADQWEDLSLHCRDGLGVDLDDLANVLRRLYNADNPEALRDRDILRRLFIRLSQNPTSGYMLVDRTRFINAVNRRVLSRFRPAPPPSPPDEPVVRPLDPLRESGLFDETVYALTPDALARGQDPLEHYLEVGEALGVAPSDRFEPDYYARRYPDVRGSGLGLLRHYALFGRHEGRDGLSPATRMDLPDLDETDRDRVIVILHEASRTGAPILGWDLVQRLREHHDVVVFLKKGGPLRAAFDAVGVPVVEMPADAVLFRRDMEAVAERLVAAVRPAYVIANSAETRDLMGPLSRAGVAVLALIHEFSASVRPPNHVHDLLVWTHRLVFPARLVSDSFVAEYPYLRQRRRDILPQGLPVPPRRPAWDDGPDDTVLARLRPPGHEDDFLVVGMGRVQFRKGVDLFLSMAARILRDRPEARIRFAWVGDGYSPDDWTEFPTYLTDQITRVGLGDHLVLAGEVDDLSRVHATADVMVMTSRLDPMPNTCIEALSLGLPVVCFDQASGIAEVLSGHPDTRDLVVPYLDTAAMAETVLALRDDPARRARLSAAARTLAAERFDMDRYVDTLDGLGLAARDEVAAMARDQDLIAASGVFDAAFFQPASETLDETETGDRGKDEDGTALSAYLLRNRLAGPGSGNDARVGLRRPFPGFNPLAYAEAVSGLDGARDPLAHWLEAGRPPGPWLYPVLNLEHADATVPPDARVLLHAHFHYVDLVQDFLDRLAGDGLACDLILTTTDEDRAIALRRLLAPRGNARDGVRVVPNRGRDIGALLTGLSDMAASDYHVIGHVHGKKSTHVGQGGDTWRHFLWEHLVGGQRPAASAAVSALLADPTLGLLFPDDPNLCGWDLNHDIARNVARRMGRDAPLPRFPDWPNGTMFWARREALAPLFALGFDWEDYPEEPAPVDGTLLHALERLIPVAAEQAGLSFATTHLPGVTR